jgi:hypothetical protein
MVRNRVAFSGLLIGVVGIGACTTLRRVQPAEFLAKNNPDVLWVTHANNTIVPVTQPEIAGDTLKGMWQGTQRRVAIPLSEVRRVRAKLPDSRKTAVLVTTLGMAGVSAVYFLWISKAGPRPEGVFCGPDQRGLAVPSC